MSVGTLKISIAVIGAGPASLMFACHADKNLYDVTIYERNQAPGRKFLVAGDGGLNLTHSEDPETFITRYTPHGFLDEAFAHLNNRDLISWFGELGVPTYTGSSGRVFPERNVKPIEVLKKMLEKAESNGAKLRYRHEWKGWTQNGDLVFDADGTEEKVKSDIVIFALGGASWPVTGSTGTWLELFSAKGIQTVPFQASNCTMSVNWAPEFISKFEGAPLKNVVISCGGIEQEGEVVITKAGLEGSGVYPLSPVVRASLQEKDRAVLSFDLKPGLTETEIRKKLEAGRGRNQSEKLRDALNLSHAQLALLKSFTPKDDFLNIDRLVGSVKRLDVVVTGLGPVEDAISTVGGIALDAIDETFMIEAMPGNYVIGEMLDYDAPTGGYLLQSCFSMGRYLSDLLNSGAKHVNEK